MRLLSLYFFLGKKNDKFVSELIKQLYLLINFEFIKHIINKDYFTH